jgi:hypothetical protein
VIQPKESTTGLFRDWNKIYIRNRPLAKIKKGAKTGDWAERVGWFSELFFQKINDDTRLPSKTIAF